MFYAVEKANPTTLILFFLVIMKKIIGVQPGGGLRGGLGEGGSPGRVTLPMGQLEQ